MWCGYMPRSAADSPVAAAAVTKSGATAAASAAAAGESEKPSGTSKPGMGDMSWGIAAGASSGCQASGGGAQLSPAKKLALACHEAR